jgi:hypothetical protein
VRVVTVLSYVGSKIHCSECSILIYRWNQRVHVRMDAVAPHMKGCCGDAMFTLLGAQAIPDQAPVLWHTLRTCLDMVILCTKVPKMICAADLPMAHTL